MTAFAKDRRNKVQRMPARGQYEREEVYQIVDAGLICHVGFVQDGQPFVIPTAYGRAGDVLYVHGARASRMQKALAALPIIVFFLLFQRSFLEGVRMGAVKG